MGQRFARCHRLTKTDEFSSVFGFRRVIRGSLLMLHYQPRSGETSPRLGIVVGKKLLKRAVHRNKFKRVVREVFRLRRACLPACDLIVRLASKPGELDGHQIAMETGQLLDRLTRRVVKESLP